MSEKIVKVDLNPIKKFAYNQIPNNNFCYLLLDQKLRAMHTPFTCKDYINDILYCENTGKEADVHGLHWKRGTFDLTPDFYYMAMLGGGFKMETIYKELEDLLNKFDEAQKFNFSEVYRTDNPEIVVIRFDKRWAECTPLISAYTSVIRLSGVYKIGVDVIEYLKELLKNKDNLQGKYPVWMRPDLQRLPKTIRRLAALLKGKKVKRDWEFDNIYECHDTGILKYDKFPEVEI